MRRQGLFAALALTGCTETNEYGAGATSLRVTLVAPDGGLGSEDDPLPFSSDWMTLGVEVESLGGPIDGAITLRVLPVGRTSPAITAVEMVAGRTVPATELRFRRAFGEVRVVASDDGYVPGDPREAACGDGDIRDDDGDGAAGYPDDPGCFMYDDTTEEPGTGAAGASEPLLFANPRVRDVQQALAGSSQPVRVQLDGRLPDEDAPGGVLLVTHRATDGFYFTDVAEPDLGWQSAFAFNFSTPRLMRGSCLRVLTAGVEEFYGFTELGSPAWQCVGADGASGVCCRGDAAYDEKGCIEPCGAALPAPVEIDAAMLSDDGEMEAWESALVVVRDLTVAARFDACDLDGDGGIDFGDCDAGESSIECDLDRDGAFDPDAGDRLACTEEACCSNRCGDQPDCSVLESLLDRDQWTATVVDGSRTAEIAIVSSAACPNFDPREHAGRTLGSITGNLRELSFGRPKWILSPRDTDDMPDCP